MEADAQRLALLVGHHGEVELDARHALERSHGRGDPVLDLLAQRAAWHGEGDQHADRAVGPQVDVAHHAQLDDRAAQLGVLHRAERLDDLLGGRHGAPRPCPRCSPVGITTTAIGRIPGWPPPHLPLPARRRRAQASPRRRARASSLPRSAPSPTPSATRRGGPSTCTPTKPATTGSRPRRWPSTSGCTPTSPATTWTSWLPVATSRWRWASPGPAPVARRSATGPAASASRSTRRCGPTTSS